MKRLLWFCFQGAIVGTVVYSALVNDPPEGMSKERGIAIALGVGVALAFAFTWMITAWVELGSAAIRKLRGRSQRLSKGGAHGVVPEVRSRHKLVRE
jgi:hypothetical protein